MFIDGFKFLREDRDNGSSGKSKGGGVCISMRNGAIKTMRL